MNDQLATVPVWQRQRDPDFAAKMTRFEFSVAARQNRRWDREFADARPEILAARRRRFWSGAP